MQLERLDGKRRARAGKKLRKRPVERLLFRLCLAAHASHPNVLRAKLNSREIAEWEAFSRIEPFGPLQDELRLAIVACAAANSNPYRKVPAVVTDFMPSYVPEWETAESIYAKLDTWASRGNRQKNPGASDGRGAAA